MKAKSIAPVLVGGAIRAALIVLAAVCLGLSPVHAQSNRPVVYVVPIDGVVDLGLAPFLGRVLDDADELGAAAVVLEISTLGGRLDAAIAIRDILLRARTPTIAFINRRAISAGALIAIAAEKVVMADGGTIGAAAPIEGGVAGTAQPVGEKTVSYVRKEFRSTAEARNRPPLIAEAMVDADVEIADVIQKGKLLTLSTKEALDLKVADFRANNLEAVLLWLGIGDAEVRRAEPNWAENLVRFLTHPVVSPLLIMLGILGVATEIRSPGFGLPGVVGLASIGLFFWGHWLVQLAGWEELLLVGIGIVLLIVEVILVPGFGLPGALGIAAMLSGFGMSLVGTGATSEAMVWAATQVLVALVLAILAALLLLRFVPRMQFGKQLVLQGELPAQSGFVSPPASDRTWLGVRGFAMTVLRPAGVADLNGARVDVVSDGDFIEAGEAIVVTRVDGNRIVVRRQAQPHATPLGERP
jgi:membrane-bound serine protease (ClpP class)